MMAQCPPSRRFSTQLTFFFLAVIPFAWLSSVVADSNASLQLRPDGILAAVHSLRFSADGQQLYAAGDEKIVQVWNLENDQFKRDHTQTLRNTIGPGPLGKIATLAIAEDKSYLAIGGIGTFKRQSSYTDSGILIPSFSWSRETLEEIGSVMLFDARNRTTSHIKAHLGYVTAAEIVVLPSTGEPFLVTLGSDQDTEHCETSGNSETDIGKQMLKLFRLPEGKLVDEWELPRTKIESKLLAWTKNLAAKSTDIRIAVTLADGTSGGNIAFFQPGKKQPIRNSNPFALAADRIRGGDMIYVSSYRGISMLDGFSGQRVKQIDLSARLSKSEFIFTLLSIPSNPSIAIFSSKDLSQPAAQHRLQLVDLSTGRFILGAGIPIGNRQNPMIAIDPTGRFVSATADVTEGIRIFRLGDLLKNNVTAMQVIRPEFQAVQAAAIVSLEGSNRLRLAMANAPSPKIYEWSRDQLQEIQNDRWQSFDKPLTFTRVQNEPKFNATIQIAGVRTSTISVDTATPPIAKWIASNALGGRPLAAVAYLQHRDEGEPRLSLFDPTTGQEVRRLSGHQQVITSIEFSADQKWLATVSVDGLVCIWKLDDLTVVFGKRGMIQGVRWCLNDGAMVVSHVDPNQPPAGLQIADSIEGLIDKDKQLRSFDSPEALFHALSLNPPGSSVCLRIKRNGNAADVFLTLGQAADERKPLFSMITKVMPKLDSLSWLAWTPAGPFQSSGPELERSAGWHFNPEEGDEPVRFAPFEQYRDQFAGDGLVDVLLTKGQLPIVWPPPVNATIGARLIDQNGDSVYATDRQFRSEREFRQLQVSVTQLPAATVSEVRAKVDDGESIILTRASFDPQVWVADVSGKLPLSMRHEVEIEVRSPRVASGLQRSSWGVVAKPKPLMVATVDPARQSQSVSPPEPAKVMRLPIPRVVSHGTKTELRAATTLADQRVRIEAVAVEGSFPEGSQFTVVRNDQEMDLDGLEADDRRVSVTVPLVLGKNRIEIVLRREGQSTSSSPIEINLIDPPEWESITATVSPQNEGKVQLILRANEPPSAVQASLSLDGIEITALTRLSPWVKTGANRFNATVDGIAIPEGTHVLQVELKDKLGYSLGPRVLTLQGKAIAKQPRLLLLLADGTAVDASEIEVSMQVISRDLKELRFRVNDRSYPVSVPEENGDGERLLSVRVPLDFGVNRVSVVAVADSGLVASASGSISRIERPVELVLKHFRMDGASPISFVAGDRDHYATASSVATGSGYLEGMVRTSRNASEISGGAAVIRAWVNGFLQSTIKLTRGDSDRELRFSIPVSLSAKENEIRLDLPGLVESETSCSHASISCDNPLYDQTLHLLIVSTQVSLQKRKEFEQRVQELLSIQDGKTAAFTKVIAGTPIYPALTGATSRSDNVRQLLEQCQFELSATQGVNSTVLLYFHGEEMRAEDGRMCLMTRDAVPTSAFEDSNLITSTYLGTQLKEMKCANLLFLDVTPHLISTPVSLAGDPAQPGLGVLRLAQSSRQESGSNPFMLEQVQKVLPRVGELAQLTRELETQASGVQQFAVTQSIPTAIETMRFGELAPSGK